MIAAQRAPDEEACFICPFIERPARSRSAPMPARRSVVANRNHIDVDTLAGFVFGLPGDGDAIYAESEPDPRQRVATKALGEPVVSPSPADRVLRSETSRYEFKCCARVVVEPTDEARL